MAEKCKAVLTNTIFFLNYNKSLARQDKLFTP